MKNVVGIDFGKVIVASREPEGGEDTSFLTGTLEDALAVPPSPGAVEAVSRLVELFGAEATWIVSKCGKKVQERSEAWLRQHRFFERTGMTSGHVRFCKERAQKAVHCLELGVTHFIDDRVDVLGHLAGLVPNLYLFGHQRPGTVVPPWVSHVPDWAAAVRAVERRLMEGT